MNDYELSLVYIGQVWRRSTSPSMMLCDRQFREHVSLPQACRAVTLVFSTKRTPESFMFTPYRVRGTNNDHLYMDFEVVLARQYNVGHRYIRVEY